MFYYVSKFVWFVVQPSNAVLLLLLAGIVLLWSRWARMGRRIVLASGVLLFAGGLTPLGHVLLLPLEDRFTRADLSSEGPPDGIVILGGAQDMSVHAARGVITVNEAAERLIEGVSLAVGIRALCFQFTHYDVFVYEAAVDRRGEIRISNAPSTEQIWFRQRLIQNALGWAGDSRQHVGGKRVRTLFTPADSRTDLRYDIT